MHTLFRAYSGLQESGLRSSAISWASVKTCKLRKVRRGCLTWEKLFSCVRCLNVVTETLIKGEGFEGPHCWVPARASYSPSFGSFLSSSLNAYFAW